jgi:hypothetical protein
VDLFLAAVWLTCTVCTLWFAAQSSGDLPKVDDWVEMVPAVSGYQPVTLEWLWTPLNEHRIPLPRLAYLTAYYVSGGDFRSSACLSVLLLSFVASLCMMFARRCRGSAMADAFLPLILLHWGQGQTFVFGVLSFVIPTVLGYLALLLVLSPEPFTIRRGLLWSLCLLGMPLCGMNGVVLCVPLAGWLAALGLNRIRAGGSERRQGMAFLLMAAGVLAIIGLYFVDFSWIIFPPQLQSIVAKRGVLGRVETMGAIVGMSLGWLGRAFWPLASVLVLLLVGAASLAAVLFAYRSRPQERLRISGGLVFMAASLFLVGAIGWGRSFTVGESLWFTTRYATVSIPVLVSIYLVSLICFTPAVGAWMRALLGLTALAVYGGHIVGEHGYP